ncbi:MAG: redoxin domain-containing protein [Cytophagales bacterium]|nr:redoxin domain-containing protein [Cytophagales bacterium]MCA6368391.1 redoxin domain-containing protein [Cytophagales bacterium]MCA6371470.1 redoxin domain-containing protein [Cytophagales bacterium]MCA6374802.1 redoxin domain-containing protein [Cytophagales bacterium]MCA6385020.1 redoxin domain-containing protein [Cytophagales bacterium]
MRNILLWCLSISFVLLVAWMANITVAKLRALDRVKEKTASLKSLPIVTMDSSKYELTNNSIPTIIILFNTTCEHCQYEATEIKKSIDFFSQVRVLMISSETIEVIKAFGDQYGLTNKPSITFAKISPDDVFETFGSVSIPHIFIYGKDRKLIKEFKGETKIDAILQYLPK